MFPVSTYRCPTALSTNDDPKLDLIPHPTPNQNSTNHRRPPTIDDRSYHSSPHYNGLATISQPSAEDLLGIIFCMRDSIANAVRLDPLIQNEQWYKDHWDMWMEEGLLDDISDLVPTNNTAPEIGRPLKNIEAITCYTLPHNTTPTIDGILQNIERNIPTDFLPYIPSRLHPSPAPPIPTLAAAITTETSASSPAQLHLHDCERNTTPPPPNNTPRIHIPLNRHNTMKSPIPIFLKDTLPPTSTVE